MQRNILGLGKGGCVVSPNYPIPGLVDSSPDKVSKIMVTKQEADEEVQIFEDIKTVDPDYEFTVPFYGSGEISKDEIPQECKDKFTDYGEKAYHVVMG